MHLTNDRHEPNGLKQPRRIDRQFELFKYPATFLFNLCQLFIKMDKIIYGSLMRMNKQCTPQTHHETGTRASETHSYVLFETPKRKVHNSVYEQPQRPNIPVYSKDRRSSQSLHGEVPASNQNTATVTKARDSPRIKLLNGIKSMRLQLNKLELRGNK